ncbi:hypothetical protein TNCV_2096681 [Trichonephila clavipes]|nr:hypothetical protein TNCV_2096681 [Trichonephila clavipes]
MILSAKPRNRSIRFFLHTTTSEAKVYQNILRTSSCGLGNIRLRREQSPVDPCFDLQDLSHIGNRLFSSLEILISEENSPLLIHWKLTLLFTGNTHQRREESPVDPLEMGSVLGKYSLAKRTVTC